MTIPVLPRNRTGRPGGRGTGVLRLPAGGGFSGLDIERQGAGEGVGMPGTGKAAGITGQPVDMKPNNTKNGGGLYHMPIPCQ